MVDTMVRNDFKDAAESLNIMLSISHSWLKDLFLELLTDAEIKVVVVDGIETLLEQLDKNTDILIVDIADYQGHYHDLFEQLRLKSPSLAILALLSAATGGYRDRILLAGANGVVMKEDAHKELIPVLMQIFNGCQINKLSSCILKKLEKKFTDFHLKEGKALDKKQKEGPLKQKFSRRTFLKASAATTAAAGAIAVNPWGKAMSVLAESNENTGSEAAEAGENIYYGSCKANCFSGCRLQIKVRAGKVVQTEMAEFPDARYNRICMKGLSHVQRIYDPNRLKYPMKRVGERGAGQWERMSWDEAIELIGSTWEQLQAQYGKHSIAFESGSGAFANGSFNSPARLKSLLGASTISGCMDNAIFYGTSNAFGIGEYYNASELTDLLNARTILIWGANPTEAQVQNWHFIAEAKESGAKVIAIDPIFTNTAAKSDRHIALRPGTDGALALAMANVIIEEGLIDETFMKKSSVAPLLVKAADGKYLRRKDLEGEGEELIVWDNAAGKYGLIEEVRDPALKGTYTVEGIKVTTAYELLLERIKKYTVQYAAELCEVPAETIREIARLYATQTPGTIYHGFGPDHYVNGHYAVFAITTLAILTGNLGKPGATAGYQMPLGFYLNTGALQKPAGSPDPGPTIPIVKLLDVVNEGKFNNGPMTLKSIYVYGSNHAGNTAERKAYLEVLEKMDLVVVADLTLSDTAQYADIVLPVAHWFEVDDMHGQISQTPYLILQEKAIEPLYESKSDWDIVSLLGRRMGFAEHFTMSHEEMMEFSLNTDYARALGITYERLKKEKVLRNVPDKPYIFGEDGTYPTPTKRAQFYLENPQPQMFFGQQIDVEKERLPHWEPPNEAWSENPLYQKYPLVYGQERPKWRVHTQWSHTPWLKELEPEPIVKISPDDAVSRNIKTGDTVKVYNDRGYVVLKAVISNGNRPGMIVIPKGWQRGQYIDGHYQDMTSRVSNEACINNCFYDALVEVEKI